MPRLNEVDFTKFLLIAFGNKCNPANLPLVDNKSILPINYLLLFIRKIYDLYTTPFYTRDMYGERLKKGCGFITLPDLSPNSNN